MSGKLIPPMGAHHLSAFVLRRQAAVVYRRRRGISSTSRRGDEMESDARTDERPSRQSPTCSHTTFTHILYGESHREMQRALEELISVEINPFVDEWEANAEFPAHRLFRQLGRMGLFGVNKPSEYGGLGLDFGYSVALAEQMGAVQCGAIPMACAVQSDMATPALARFGSARLKREFLAPSISGERVACIGVTEPTAGSDVSAIRTTARVSGADLLVDGQKCWITNGAQADWMCLLANTPDELVGGGDDEDEASSRTTRPAAADPHRNKSLICVDMREPGITVTRRMEKLGMRSSDTAEIFFDAVRVPVTNIIGRAGLGFHYQMAQFQNERLVAAAVVLKPLERLIHNTVHYTLNRRLFGGAAFDRHETVRYRLAELRTDLEALRALLYRATRAKMEADRYVETLLNNGAIAPEADEDALMLASMVKLKAGRLSRRVTDECLQLWGANGYAWESEASRAFRDFRLISIAAGCDEVMLQIIAKQMRRQAQ